MRIQAIKTRKVLPPQDDITDILKQVAKQLSERSILAVTSKIVSIWEGQCIKISDVPDKDALIIKESHQYLPREHVPGGWVMHTIKNNLFVPTAGIDASNTNDYYTLWPKDPHQSAKKIWDFIRQESGLKDIGVVITDSHSIPMRWGVVGISLGHFGFKPLVDYRGTADLFGREFKISQANIPDGVAGAAVFAMGEGTEQTPLAIVTELPATIEFVTKVPEPKHFLDSFEVPMEYDLYKPFLEGVPWKKGGSDK